MSLVNPFRSEAEDAFSHPAQLATGLKVVRPGYMAAVLAAAFVILGAIAAAAFVQVPIEVKGTGVILSSKGVLEIAVSAAHEGRVVDLMVDVGERVEPGQEIARVTQPALENERKLADNELDLVQQEIGRVKELQASQIALADDVRRQQEAGAREAIDLLQQRVALLAPLAEKLETMFHQGTSTIDRFLLVKAELAEAREQLVSKRSSLLAQVADRGEKEAQYEREMQGLISRRAQAQRQLQRIDDRLNNETVIRSPQSGIVSELKMMPGDLVRFDTPIVSLLPVDESFGRFRPDASRLVAAVLVPAQDGKKITPGMRTLIEPASVRRDVFGAIQGSVLKVSEVAASPEQLRHMLRNEALVQRLSANGTPFLVTVALQRSRTTKSGFAWTSSSGPDARITSGTLLQAEIETESVPVLQLLLPALKDLLRGPNRQGSL